MLLRIFVHCTRRSSLAALLMLVLLSGTTLNSHAQSGRRPPKPPTSPDPLPPKQEEPPIKPSTDQNSKSQIPVKVIWYLRNVNFSTFYARIVQDGCLERLSQARSVNPTTGAEANRKQAIDMAKASTDTYVLWYEFDLEIPDTDRYTVGAVPPQYLYVRYEVFTPGTGKRKTAGSIYQRPRGPGGVPLPIPGPRTTGAAEYSLRYAGREMADRLLDTLGLPRPADRP
jgi:hypothetical protein